MEEKEQKQKNFFKAMEANILNSLSQGVVPGTPKDEPASVVRKKSSRMPPVTGQRPELVRTISTMDDTVLRDLIRRQPSFRNVQKKPSLSKKTSLQISDIDPGGAGKRGSAISDGLNFNQFESFVSIKEGRSLDPLDEGQDDGQGDDSSLPELFSYLPDEGYEESDFGDNSSVDFESEVSMRSNRSTRSDAGKFNESSLTGFGLTWEETQALKKLADITKEMIDAEHDEDLDLGDDQPFGGAGGAGATPSWKAKDSKGMRDLPREIELDDDSESDGESPANQNDKGGSAAFQKPKEIGGQRALPRELDFEDSDSDNESDFAPTPMQKSKAAPPVTKREEEKSAKPNAVDAQRPQVKRRNTCGTLYVGTTMSAPDKDATIKCVCGVYRTHILSSRHDIGYNSDTDSYRAFNDHESQQGKTKFLLEKHQPSVPSLDEVTRFYRDTFYKAQMEADCIIMSLIYVERLIKKTGGALRPRPSNWRSLIFSCMILSSKVWDDLSMWNADFSQSCPPGVTFPLQRINALELGVLNALNFKVKVPASEYAKYYFLLRSMLIKSGLGGDEMGALNPLDVMGARRLQQVSSQFEFLSLNNKASALANRSQSLNVHDRSRASATLNAPAKVGLEHVVKM